MAFYVDKQGWKHCPKVLIMRHKTGYGPDETRRYVPETKYQMAMDELRESRNRLEMMETIAKARRDKCISLKETNADLRAIIEELEGAMK